MDTKRCRKLTTVTVNYMHQRIPRAKTQKAHVTSMDFIYGKDIREVLNPVEVGTCDFYGLH